MSERDALNSLRELSSITIRKADKGSCSVILNTSDYIAEAENQLSDSSFYSKLPPDHDLDLRARELVHAQLLALKNKNAITSKQWKFLHDSTLSTRKRRFYTLPKIHKPRDSWFNDSCPPGRPIISALIALHM